ncbi:flavin-containing monooxygenase [Rhodococcus sp. T7]|uniref:flavin-containing monooxygenase n=1 Tax=Rhodococcus sp. T7 TaxID=627444 RepID=UPI00135AA233|nr:NAD(P)/FAD-dependent oxidoreductase [Rhodococcus sp. T7]KAF0957120.1 Phenylacetone monooxygenase [Rhodococcus sp. T7]KAF0958845.1 Phenylacetone monooxygenase [Rhodococcus sp. T7]
MATSQRSTRSSQDTEILDALVIGTGISGIHQLHRLAEEGRRVIALEAGPAVGGTWFWNSYPGARTDSEAYTYCYFFSKELLQEWDWPEHFASQPQLNRYLNHVVDRFGIRPLIHFNTTVTAATWNAEENYWEILTNNGERYKTHILVTAIGFLSDPHFPAFPGREKFRGESHHTARWPGEVSFANKRVAVIGTGSSGVQVIQTIADDVASLTVFQRTPNWATPLNNGPVSPDELETIKATYDQIHASTQNLGGFVHDFPDLSARDHDSEQRQLFWEELWDKRGFASLFSNYPEVMESEEINREYCDFIAEKIRSRVNDPEIAAKLIPTDHGYAAKRPPMEIGYYEAYNRDNVELIDTTENPILEITELGIKTKEREFEFDLIIYATGFDVGTGAFNKIDITGLDDKKLKDEWANGPITRMGMLTPNFPNLLMIGGVQALVGNVPRVTEYQVEFAVRLLEYMDSKGHKTVDADQQAAKDWVDHLAGVVDGTIFDGASSWQWGANIPGKARSFLLYPAGLPAYKEWLSNTEASGYDGLEFT